MKTKLTFLVALLVALHTPAAEAPNAALQKGLFEEEANQNFEAAISAYQSALKSHADERRLAATALFRLGECYRKLGRTNDAIAQYQRLVAEFPDQATLADLSRQNLVQLGAQETARSQGAFPSARQEQKRLLEEEVRLLERELGRQRELVGQKVVPESTLVPTQRELLTLRRQLVALASPDSAIAGPIADDAVSRAQLKELLQSEIKIAEQFAAEQRRKVETGTVAKGEEVRFERDVLNLKRQLLSTDGLASSKDRRQWRELLLEEIALAEEATRLEKQKLDAGKGIASEVARLQRDVLILKRELVAFDAAPEPAAAGQSRSTESASAPTDEEEKEIRRIQALIRDSPDLINATGGNSTPLHLAAARGQLVVARFLLENGANIDQPSSDMAETALALAAAQGHKKMVELLLSKGANPNAKGMRHGRTPLHEAASKGFAAVVEVLLANKAEVEARNNTGETPLHLAIAAGQTPVVEALLKRGAEVNARRDNGDTPMHFAAGRSDASLIPLLLNRGADINAKNKTGVPPLWVALDQGHGKAARTLLEKGADPDFGVNGAAPVHRAVARNSVELLQLLLAHKAQPDLPNGSGVTPLQSVVFDGRKPELIPILVKAGANPNTPLPVLSATLEVRDPVSRSVSGRNVSRYPLLVAALIGRDLPTVEALLANGASVNSASPEGGHTAVMHAIYSGSPELLDAVLRYKPDLEIKTLEEGRTALHQTVASGSPEATEALIKAGAKVDTTDSKGWTPLHHAALLGKPEVAGILLRAGADPNLHALDGSLPLANARSTQFNYAGVTPAGRQEVAKLLLQQGADESLLRRRSITVTRRGRNYERVVFRKGTNDFNRFSLYELVGREFAPSLKKLPFPDLRQIAIERFQDGGGTRQILVDLEARAADPACTNDLWLEWGDLLEIRETEHPLNATWSGLEGTMATNISQCLGRTVNLVIKGRTNRVELKAGAGMAGQTMIGTGQWINGFHISHDSFRLTDVLQRSGLLLTTSDLARVRVRRREPLTGQLQEWILDETKPNHETDLWLRDGDVIEVPEKQ